MSETPISKIFQTTTIHPLVKSKFGDVPVGSPLSYQYPMLASSLNVTCSSDIIPIPIPPIIEYPCFPINSFSFIPLRHYLDKTASKEYEFLTKLQIDYMMSQDIERETRSQASSQLWQDVRKFRFTASRFYEFSKIKTSNGLISYAKRFIKPREHNKFLANKLEYGKSNEPVALKLYEAYYKGQNHPIQIYSSGIMIPPNAFILGASPDGKVIDSNESDIFVLVEIKCPEKYSEHNIADVAQV